MKHNKNFSQRKNPKAKERELQASWEALLAKHSKPLERGLNGRKASATVVAKTKSEAVQQVKTSFESMKGVGALPPKKVYTGTEIVGIATMHKSNLVPVFNNKAAVELAQMRRG